MPLDFPSNPFLNQVYVANGKAWRWNGAAWETHNASLTVDDVSDINGISGSVSITAGANVTITKSGQTLTIASSGGGGGGMTGAVRFTYSSTEPAGASSGDEWLNSVDGKLYTFLIDAGEVTGQWVELSVVPDSVSTSLRGPSGDTLGPLTFAQQATSDYTLVIGDAAKTLEMSYGLTNYVRIPSYGNVAFPTGTQIMLMQTGTGSTVLTAAAGVTLNSRNSMTTLLGQWSVATLINRSIDNWVVYGDIS